MKKQIVKVSLVQSAKVIALMYLLLSVPIVGLMFTFAPVMMPGVGGAALFLMVPLFYALFCFIGIIISGWLYNLSARMVGGIEYTTADV
ncbi:hypothetical protein [Massilia soli]|uniref:DUF3566 domain-containing protein n=1 Tax=Massilia soli TaxID=2792854 RepID=A0ABS7SRK0_9BURK|nr:hypothetical protein [Massilia soli]MBZ2208560.1 hypothetical protein [Massilia soli]